MRIEVSDTAQANDAFSLLNLDVRGVQLETGKIRGAIEASKVGDALFLSAFFDRRTLFTGARMPGMVPLAFMGSGDSFYHGETTLGRELCGFKDDLTDTHVHWHGEMCVTYLPQNRLKAYLHQINAMQALDRLDRLNQLPLSEASLQTLSRLFYRGLEGKVPSDEKVYGTIALLLEEPVEPEPADHDPKNDPLIREFVQVAHDMDQKEPLTLLQIATGLFTTQKTLQRHCKEAYGIGPKQLVDRVRMEQARMLLVKDGLTPTAVARAFGFTRPQEFARKYRTTFGVTPSFDHQRSLPRLKGI